MRSGDDWLRFAQDLVPGWSLYGIDITEAVKRNNLNLVQHDVRACCSAEFRAFDWVFGISGMTRSTPQAPSTYPALQVEHTNRFANDGALCGTMMTEVRRLLASPQGALLAIIFPRYYKNVLR